MDQGGFEEFYRREFARMTTLAALMTGDVALGEDIAQDALLAAQQQWARVSRLDRPGAWLRRVTVNRAIGQLRRRTVERTVLRRLGRDHPWVCETSGGEVTVADPAVLSAVRALPPRQRVIVVLAYLEDLPQAEIAELLGCAVGTVKAQLFKARSTLARSLTTTAEETRS